MKTAKRRYLTAAERKQEILDAAFIEFSAGGFLATSLERIATRAGISKSGIYAHYKSKHDIFEDMLLTRLLNEDSRLTSLELETTQSLPALIEQHVERRYAALGSSQTIGAFRLLIAESGRTPELVQQCASRLVQRILEVDRQFIEACNRSNLTRQQVNPDDYLLSGAPASLWLVLITIFGEQNAPIQANKIKKLHKKLLLDSLTGSDPVTTPS